MSKPSDQAPADEPGAVDGIPALDGIREESGAGLTEHADESATLSSNRLMVLLRAAWELDTLADLLTTVTSNETNEALRVGHRVRCIAIRIKQLASIQMSGLGDDMVTTEELHRILEVAS